MSKDRSLRSPCYGHESGLPHPPLKNALHAVDVAQSQLRVVVGKLKQNRERAGTLGTQKIIQIRS